MKSIYKSAAVILSTLIIAAALTACNSSPDEGADLIDANTDIELLVSDKIESEAAWLKAFDFPDSFSVKRNRFGDIPAYWDWDHLKFENMEKADARLCYEYENFYADSDDLENRNWYYVSREAGNLYDYCFAALKFDSVPARWMKEDSWWDEETFLSDYNRYIEELFTFGQTYKLATYSEEYNGYILTSANLLYEGLTENMENLKYVLKFRNGKFCGIITFDGETNQKQTTTLFYNIGSTKVVLPKDYEELA